MAKKSFNISSTLKKNKEVLDPKLPEKVELKKKPRDFEGIKDKVDGIHQAAPKEAVAKEAPKPVSKVETQPAKEKHEVDLSVEKVSAAAPSAKSVEIPQTIKKTPVTKPKVKPSNTVKEKMVRMTIDTPEGMHRKLKIKSIEQGVSMRDYILRLIAREIKKG